MKLRVAERSPVGVSVMGPFFMCFLVHTVDTTRTSWVLEQMVKMKQPVILVGESGTSKTATTQNFLKHLNKEADVRSVCIHDGVPRNKSPWLGAARECPRALRWAWVGLWGGLARRL